MGVLRTVYVCSAILYWNRTNLVLRENVKVDTNSGIVGNNKVPLPAANLNWG